MYGFFFKHCNLNYDIERNINNCLVEGFIGGKWENGVGYNTVVQQFDI